MEDREDGLFGWTIKSGEQRTKLTIVASVMEVNDCILDASSASLQGLVIL